MGSFQYKNDSNQWVDVPDTAKPDAEQGAIVVLYPETTARDGMGLPCGAVGLPRISIKFTKMLGTGMDFWRNFFATASALSVTLTGVTAFDPRSGTWKKYTGTLLRPSFSSVQAASSSGRSWYRDGEIVVDSVTETT